MPLALLPARAVIEVSGADRVAFLQGLVSNDVARAAPGFAVWAALLTPQGKYLADFFILSDGARLLLDAEAATAEDTVRRFSRYRLRADAQLRTLPWHVAAAWGPGLLPLAPHGDEGAAAVSAPDPRHPDAGLRIVSPVPPIPDADAAAYDRHRLSLGLSDGTRDLEREKTVLMEAGFDPHGIAWDKGCYMGQELTARTRYRGLVKRHLVRVAIDGPVPPPGTPVTTGGAGGPCTAEGSGAARTVEVGTMRSAVPGLGLASLRLDAARPLACGEARLTVLAAPLLSGT